MSQPLKKVGQFRFIRKIGKGATSEVFEARKEGSAEKFAVKMIRLKGLNEQQKQMITKEVSIIKGIEHPNIVHLFETFETTNNYYLVFELCEQGDLEKYLMEYCGPRIPEETAQRIIFCIADAVSLIHSKGIAHRDIKLANILLKKDFKIKLADFGFAKSFNEDVLMETYCGTPITMAPQILLSHPYDNKCDIWSLGIILFQLIYGRLPFSITDGLPKFMQYVTKKPLEIPSQPPMPLEFKELLHRSLEKNPSKRLSINEFISNKWVSSGNSIASPKGKTKRVQSVEELLKNISHDYRMVNQMDKISSTDSSEVELIVAQRVNRTLIEEFEKILLRHVDLRTSLQQRVKNEHTLTNLLLYLDYKYLEYLSELPLKIGKQTASQTIKCKELQGVEFPKTLSTIIPQSDATGNIILNYLQKKSQTTNDLSQKIKEYQIVVDFMEMIQRFEIRVVIMFANHLYEDIEIQNVLQYIKSKRINGQINQEIEFSKGNFITIAIECTDKDDRMKTVRENFVNNCRKRINEIERQINGYY